MEGVVSMIPNREFKLSELSKINSSASEIDAVVNKSSFTPYIKTGKDLKVIAFGDSITQAGQTPSSKLFLLTGYWTQASINVKKDFYFLDGKGISGNTTAQLLARMNDVLLSGANVCLLHIGTNDLFANIPLETIYNNYISICSQMTEIGIEVVVLPILYRDAFDLSKIDTLNKKYEEYSKINNKVHFLFNATENFNKKLLENPLNVTRDGLHPNCYGAFLLGKNVARFLDDNFNSYSIRTIKNTNPFLIGTAGTLSSGATGVAPTGYTVYNCEYSKIKTQLGESLRTSMSPSETPNTTQKATIALTGIVPVVGKKYMIEVKAKLPDLTHIKAETSFIRLLTKTNIPYDLVLSYTPSLSIDVNGNSVDYSDSILRTPIFSCEETMAYFNAYVTFNTDNMATVSVDIEYIKILEF